MKIYNSVKQGLNLSLIGVAFGVLAGWGVSNFLLAQPSFAQSESLQLSPNAPRRRVQIPAATEPGDYQVKGEKLQRCVPEANTDKKKCTDVISGYGQIVNFGTDLYSQGNMGGAETIFRQLITAFPKEATPYLRLGIILERQDKVDEAIAEYRKAIEINPKHAVARNSLGVALAKQGQLTEAIDQWKQALAINAEYADVLTNLGLAFLQQGNKDEAVANLKKAKDLFIQRKEFPKAKQVEEILQRIDAKTT